MKKLPPCTKTHKNLSTITEYSRISDNQKWFDITQSKIIYHPQNLLNFVHTWIGLREKHKQLN